MTEYKVEVYGTRTEWRNLGGAFHRDNGPAIEYTNGNKYWYMNGKIHREDGPAVEYTNGSKYWYMNGKLHRDNGPAIEFANGDKEWWVNGKNYSEQSFNNYIKKQNKPCLGKKVIVDGIEYELR